MDDPPPGIDRERHSQMRMCLGCGERLPQGELIRLQLTREGVVIVERADQRRAGRSVYLCPRLGCFDAMAKRGGIPFKRSKYDKIIVRLEARQVERLRYAFAHAAGRLRGELGVGPRD